MSELLGDVGVVFLFILIGGFFNAAEISMISLRETQVRHLAATKGARGERLERLVSDPNRFLAAVQIGVTVATMLSSAFGAATVSQSVGAWLVTLGVRSGLADTIALIGVTLIISFFSLVLGELTPKRLALQRRETIALFAAGPISVLARLFRPVVWLLGKSTNLMVRVLRGDVNATGQEITSEELQSLVAAHESLTSVERRMIADVFDAEDTHVREVMVPRRDVDFLPASLTLSRAVRLARAGSHSRFPVIGRDADEVLGVVHIRDLLVPSHPLGRAATVGDIALPVTVIPGTKGVLDALHEMRGSGQHLAVVVDEYGGTDGIVTVEDLVEEIVGEMMAPVAVGDRLPPRAGEVDGLLNLDDFTDATGTRLPPGPYTTAAGYLMARLGRLPAIGDTVTLGGRTLTVAAMDGRRVSRIAVGVPSAIPASPPTVGRRRLDRGGGSGTAGPAASAPAGSAAPDALPAATDAAATDAAATDAAATDAAATGAVPTGAVPTATAPARPTPAGPGRVAPPVAPAPPDRGSVQVGGTPRG